MEKNELDSKHKKQKYLLEDTASALAGAKSDRCHFLLPKKWADTHLQPKRGPDKEPQRRKRHCGRCRRSTAECPGGSGRGTCIFPPTPS